ncbi:hypothetical protein EV1_000654 [Malus domestica]
MCGYHGLEIIDACASKDDIVYHWAINHQEVSGNGSCVRALPMVKGRCMLPKGYTMSLEKLIRGEIERLSKCSATLSALKASSNMILTEALVSTRIRRTSKLAM